MNRKWKEDLRLAFEAPAPMKKTQFLRDIKTPPIRFLTFVCSQITYIRKWVWGVSMLIFAMALASATYLERDTLWCVSAFMPLLALSVITESGRSEIYGMAEFEFSTRFSLKSVMLARLSILGLSNLILICLLMPLTVTGSGVTIPQTGVYMECPYLLTTFLGLWVVRRVHGKESSYLCMGIAACVSVGHIWLYQSFPTLYGEPHFFWWMLALLILGIGTGTQCYKMLKGTEELAWNL